MTQSLRRSVGLWGGLSFYSENRRSPYETRNDRKQARTLPEELETINKPAPKSLRPCLRAQSSPEACRLCAVSTREGSAGNMQTVHSARERRATPLSRELSCLSSPGKGISRILLYFTTINLFILGDASHYTKSEEKNYMLYCLNKVTINSMLA